MAKTSASIPQGVRDFNAQQIFRRQYIINTIQAQLQKFGFEPLETPSFENLQTLMGKYGEEGDKLIFKILNNGLDNLQKKEAHTQAFANEVLQGKSSPQITERALRYDLTIPFARYVAMNQNQLVFPYKRYQIQPVWRADRPQKGRYREFTQCDADIIGSASLFNEVDLVRLYHNAFTGLQLHQYTILINSRKILAAIAEAAGGENALPIVAYAIDKFEKIGWEQVSTELSQKGINEFGLEIIEKYVNLSGKNFDRLTKLKTLLPQNQLLESGIGEVSFVLERSENIHLIFDPTLARGLDYYTGIILEAKAPPEVPIGSIGGGGRYDNLTGLFGVPNITGVGISFGIDRMYDVLEYLQLFPTEIESTQTILFANLGLTEADTALKFVNNLRQQGFSTMLYPDLTKLDKQLKYADKKHYPYCVIIGSKELEEQQATIKNMQTGSQQTISFNALASYFSEVLS